MLIKNHFSAAAPLTVRGMEWKLLTETVCRMAGFCSSVTAPALPYYRTSCTYAKPALPPSMVVGAASEHTWTYLQRVSGNSFQFMSRIVLI